MRRVSGYGEGYATSKVGIMGDFLFGFFSGCKDSARDRGLASGRTCDGATRTSGGLPISTHGTTILITCSSIRGIAIYVMMYGGDRYGSRGGLGKTSWGTKSGGLSRELITGRGFRIFNGDVTFF